jgi:uncharacterized protein (TIGR02596 family)
MVEILLVVVIISVMIGLAVPALNTLSNANLQQGVEMLESKLSLARQTAIRENRPIEFRFYYYSDPSVPGDEKQFKAFQYLKRETDRDGKPLVLAISNIERLPGDVIILDHPQFSTLVTDPRLQGAAAVEIGPETGDATYFAFSFLPNGSVALPDEEAGAWFLTIIKESGANSVDGDLPANFITLQIEPFSGAIRRLQPRAG